jgi:hypothetical protein
MKYLLDSTLTQGNNRKFKLEITDTPYDENAVLTMDDDGHTVFYNDIRNTDDISNILNIINERPAGERLYVVITVFGPLFYEINLVL